jgi:acyl-CoA thioesterase
MAEQSTGTPEHLSVSARVQSDSAFLGLEGDPVTGRFGFVVDDRLARLDGRLYGGTAIAVSIAAAEQVTDRPALWMTTQFVSTAGNAERIGVHVEVLAPGRRTNQVRVTGTDAGGSTVFASVGATGHHRLDGLAGTFERCPVVTAPDGSERWATPFSGMARAAGIELPPNVLPPETGFSAVIELRHAEILDHPDPGPGRTCVWVRRKDSERITPALAAYMADMVPLSVAQACGVFAGGISLDNSIRIGAFAETEWILLDLRPHLAVGDYGHGSAHIWDAEGHLLATASQTASMRRFDPANLPWVTGRGGS